MGKSSNKRKAVRQSAALVKECSKGGITVRAKRAFPPELMHLVVHAIRHFINDRTGEGMKLVVELRSHGYDFYDFTMASTTNPQLGDSDPLIWAWGAASRSSLLWMTADCLSRGRIDPNFFVILPHQLELVAEDSERFRLGAEVFTLLASYLVSIGDVDCYEDIFESAIPRACAIFKGVMAEIKANEERETLTRSTPVASSPTLPRAAAAAAAAGRL